MEHLARVAPGHEAQLGAPPLSFSEAGLESQGSKTARPYPMRVLDVKFVKP